MVGRWFYFVAALGFLVTSAPLRAQAVPAADKPAPSAELITDAEQSVLKEPALEPGEEPLPKMDSPLPGEENIFGDDLFGTGTASSGGYSRSAPRVPARLPVLEDPREAERKARIRLRKLKARIEQDPRLVELRMMAEKAPAPEDYRAARRAWYALFFDKVRRADPSLKDYADKLEKESAAGLFQTRVEPTWPLREPPLPQPQAKFVPPQQYPGVLPADEEPVSVR
ncbi:MAG: hypothetical protein FGM15_05750 [Chthoniobacterales bacterium]|nr:hypothetical protein [Chthoniobacterales bacterium]